MSRFPIGAIVPYGAETVPDDFLECNGASLVRGDYADLFGIIGTVWGTVDATHFNLPDLRGRFIRGWDHAVARDPDRAARTACNTGGATADNVGSVQSHQFYSHAHVMSNYKTGGTIVNTSNSDNMGGAATTVSSSGGNESRSINAGAMFIIRYQ